MERWLIRALLDDIETSATPPQPEHPPQMCAGP